MATVKLGIQLYTVREWTEEDTFRETLTRLAGLGFEGVELAWKYGGMGPGELADFLASLSLECCGLHVQLEELLDPANLVYEYADACGSRYITTSLCTRVAEWNEWIPRVEEAGRTAAGKGLRFTYHNHWQELEAHLDGECALDALFQSTDASFVGAEIDIGWVTKGGADAMAYWRQYGERTPQVHLRDFDTVTGRVCDVGDGFIDPGAVVAQARELGTDWLVYEQDEYPVSAFDSCATCADRMRKAFAE